MRARGLCPKHYERWRAHGDPTYTEWDKSSEARFLEKVVKTPTCWLWQGAVHSSGYGAMYVVEDARMRPAHAWAYENFRGQIPEGLVIDHICHNKLCVNPSHLRTATLAQNAQNRSGLDANNSSGFRGVTWNAKNKKWYVRVYHLGKCYYGGQYDDVTAAGEAARQLRLRLFTHNELDRLMVD